MSQELHNLRITSDLRLGCSPIFQPCSDNRRSARRHCLQQQWPVSSYSHSPSPIRIDNFLRVLLNSLWLFSFSILANALSSSPRTLAASADSTHGLYVRLIARTRKVFWHWRRVVAQEGHDFRIMPDLRLRCVVFRQSNRVRRDPLTDFMERTHPISTKGPT